MGYGPLIQAEGATGRIAIVDVGSDSTQLLIAEPGPDGPRELERRQSITSLATRVDATGVLDPDAVQRVLATLDRYDEIAAEHGCSETLALLTSAVRDARDGDQLARTLAARGYEVTVLDEASEAELTFRGITSGRVLEEPTVVIDIGGGSTEIVIGTSGGITFATSVRVGAVRQLERHVQHDPPTVEELDSLRREVRDRIERSVPQDMRAAIRRGLATAGTDSWLSAPGDFVLTRDFLTEALARFTAMTVTERSAIPGIDPARGPTICVGAAILLEAMLALGLDALEMSNRGVLDGAALGARLPAR